MMTMAWLLALLFDVAFLLLAVFTAASPAVAGLGRAMGGVATVALAVTITVLGLARVGRAATPQAASALRLACVLAPLSWAVGTLDARLPSLTEAGFLLLAALVSAGNWRVYRRLVPPA